MRVALERRRTDVGARARASSFCDRKQVDKPERRRNVGREDLPSALPVLSQMLKRNRMIRSLVLRSAAAIVAVAALFLAPSARAQNPAASLFICDVPAAQGGCANGGGSPEGSVTFTFSGMTGSDAFINGAPATSPTQASEAGNDLPDLGLAKIGFSFSWLAQGSTTSPQTIFFYGPGGKVSDVLNYVYSREGLDLMNLFGYVVSAQLPSPPRSWRMTASLRPEAPRPMDCSISPIPA